ncbi:hypothetical protein M408DRAFT_28578 [Serendipita vermifera MAFF 305830]|uniref:Uncharacterized protein n=1 Tax=Serendipita vermifera MAFF 305830 TaxID=933852 RepID=A0A0C3ARE4_SERVB|nr:hypothetical protein M408DRAFT_28578 [Serendipita vermifera MAFF 305830]
MDFQWNEEFFLDTDDSNNTLEIATDAVSSGRIGNSLDIVSLLPPEISWRCIFESLPSVEELSWRSGFRSFPIADPRGSYSSSLFQLTSVSTKWLDLIIHYPLLWSEIHITSSNEDLLATLATFIQLSGTTPLKVVIWCGHGIEWDSICKLLQAHKHRINKLVLDTLITTERVYGVEQVRKLRHFQEFMKSLGHLSGLIELNFGDFMKIDNNLSRPLELLPRARIVTGMEYELKHDPILKDAIERSLAKQMTINVDRNVDPEPRNRSFTVVPPHLQFFDFSGPHSPNVDVVFQLSRSSLRHLSLLLSVPRVGELVENLRLLIQLQKLRLTLLASAPKDFRFPVKPTEVVVTSLRELYIVIGLPDDHSGLLDMGISGYLLQVFASLYPCARKVELHRLNIRGLPALRCFKNLEYLSLSLRTNVDNNDKIQAPLLQRRISFPSLLYIETGDYEIISLLHTPKLHRLRFHHLSSMEIFERSDLPELCLLDISPNPIDVMKLNVEPAHLPNLRELRIIADHAPILSVLPSFPSFPCLRSITWHSRTQMNPEGNRLCIIFLENPGLCPSLEELHFNDYVEWDILFLMLQRRNFEVVGVRMIHTVTMPFVPLDFQDSFTDLLKGKYTYLPPDIDLSPESAREALCDPNM